MEARVGDVGNLIIVDVYYLDSDRNKIPLDISGATLLALDVIHTGNSTNARWTCQCRQPTQMSYTTKDGDLPIAETILITPYVEWSANRHFRGSEPIELYVI